MPNRAERRAAERAARAAQGGNNSAFRRPESFSMQGEFDNSLERAMSAMAGEISRGELSVEEALERAMMNISPDFTASIDGEPLQLRNRTRLDMIRSLQPIRIEMDQVEIFASIDDTVRGLCLAYLTNNEEIAEQIFDFYFHSVVKFADLTDIEPDECFNDPDAPLPMKVAWLTVDMAKCVKDLVTGTSIVRHKDGFFEIMEPFFDLIPDYAFYSYLEAGMSLEKVEEKNPSIPYVSLGTIEELIYLNSVVGGGYIDADDLKFKPDETVSIKQKHADFIAMTMTVFGEAYAAKDEATLLQLIEEVVEKFGATLTGEVARSDGYDGPPAFRRDYPDEPSIFEKEHLSSLLGCIFNQLLSALEIVRNGFYQGDFKVDVLFNSVSILCPNVGASSWKVNGGIPDPEAMGEFVRQGRPCYDFPTKWNEEFLILEHG